MGIKFYNLYEFINDIYFEKYLITINELIFSQFKSKLTLAELHNNILLQDSIFINFDDYDEKLIAIAFVNYSREYKSLKKYSTYVLLENCNINDFTHFYLYPYINTFCRNPDKKYKGYGTELIKYIFNYYTNEGEENVYLSAGSNLSLKDNFYQDKKCGLADYKYNMINTPYYETNQKLIKYYKSLGFERLENIYSLFLCDYNTRDYVLLDVLCKKLKKNEI